MHPADTAALVATLMTLIGRMQVLGAATDSSYRMHEAMSEALTTAAAASFMVHGFPHGVGRPT